jgi:hypothetical protein
LFTTNPISADLKSNSDHRSGKPASNHLSNGTRLAVNVLFNFLIILKGVRQSPLGTAVATGLLYQPQMIENDGDDCGAIGGMKISRGNRSTRRKPAPALLCSPQIPHDYTWARTQAAAVGNHRLTTWATARPFADNLVTKLWAGRSEYRCSIPGCCRDHPAPPIQWVPGSLSTKIQRPRRKSGHWPSSIAEFKNAWSCASNPPHFFVAWWLIKCKR